MKETLGFCLLFHNGKTKFIPFDRSVTYFEQRECIKRKYGDSIKLITAGKKSVLDGMKSKRKYHEPK